MKYQKIKNFPLQIFQNNVTVPQLPIFPHKAVCNALEMYQQLCEKRTPAHTNLVLKSNKMKHVFDVIFLFCTIIFGLYIYYTLCFGSWNTVSGCYARKIMLLVFFLKIKNQFLKHHSSEFPFKTENPFLNHHDDSSKTFFNF